jgi:hypothetical protein
MYIYIFLCIYVFLYTYIFLCILYILYIYVAALQALDVTTPNFFVFLAKSNRLRIVTAAAVLDVSTELPVASLGSDVTGQSCIYMYIYIVIYI